MVCEKKRKLVNLGKPLVGLCQCAYMCVRMHRCVLVCVMVESKIREGTVERIII